MASNSAILAIFGLPGGSEWVVIGLVALVIFGKRLPEVGRSLGRGIVEFKKGLQGVKDELDNVGVEEPQPPARSTHDETPPSQS